MAQRKLTEAQLEVLRWIGDGCPEGVVPEGDYSRRITAAALVRRGLVERSGRGPTWAATITEAGREYLKRAEAPDAPKPRQANVSVTQQLVDDVIGAGGRLRLPQRRFGQQGGVDYRNRVQLAERYGKVPAGKRLEVAAVSHDELEIRLIDAPEGTDVEPSAVPVPERVGRYHPVVKGFRDAVERHEVSRAALPRAQRILEGLVLEAERRGHRVEAASVAESERYDQRGWRGSRDGHIVVSVGDRSETLRIREEGLPSRAHWERQNRRYSGWPDRDWKLPPLTEYEEGATGRLDIEISSGYARRGRPARWADRKSWTLEQKLPEVLREIEVRAAEADHARREAEQREARREKEWEAAMERAKARWLEAHRGDVLRRQASEWTEVDAIRSYCDAAETAHGGDPRTMEWIAWARAYADSLDPLREAPHEPIIPESVPSEELRPYLGGWDPSRPNRGWR